MNRQAALDARANELEQSLAGVLADSISSVDATADCPETPWSIDDYIERRLHDQLRFYENGITRSRKMIRRARAIAITLGVVAVFLSISAGGTDAHKTQGSALVAALLGVVTTAAAAIAAAFQSARHQQIALTYQTAFDRLQRLAARNDARTRGAALVVDSEAICQAEHMAWLMTLQPTVPSLTNPNP